MKHLAFILLFIMLCPAAMIWADSKDTDVVMARVLPLDSPEKVKQACNRLGLTPGNMVFYAPDKHGRIFIITPAQEDVMLTVYNLDNDGKIMEPFILQHHFVKGSGVLLQVDVPPTPRLAICAENKFYVKRCWQVRVEDKQLRLDEGFALMEEN